MDFITQNLTIPARHDRQRAAARTLSFSAVRISLTISAHPSSAAWGPLIPDASAPRFGASVDREVLMSQDSLEHSLAGAPEFSPPDSQALAPHEIVPMLIGSTVEAIERELVVQTLARCDGNRTRAARVLGVSVRTLRNKLRLYASDGLDIPVPS
jgi:hypothetical protein